MALQNEATPLISGAVPVETDYHQGETRRRNVPQHHSKYNTSNRRYESSKEDRRSMTGRIRSVARGLASQIWDTPFFGNSTEEFAESYEDNFNDESWRCSFGTTQNDGVWLNVTDRVGTIMSSMVWILIAYSCVTIGLLAQFHHISSFIAMIYFTIAALALACHAKTTFTDPGAIPLAAVPIDVYGTNAHAMCSRCQSYKPHGAHHCRICDRCVSRMDHHCPWMNNCIGAGNLKHFLLFLIYTWILSAFALLLFTYNYFFCTSDKCQFSLVLVQLVRSMTLIGICSLLFISSMISSVLVGIITGIGTIDRLKKRADNTWSDSMEAPLELKDVFGMGRYWTWFVPVDPVFEDFDRVMGYSTPQRLLREGP